MIKQNTNTEIIFGYLFFCQCVVERKDGLPDPDGSRWIIFNMSAITSIHPRKKGSGEGCHRQRPARSMLTTLYAWLLFTFKSPYKQDKLSTNKSPFPFHLGCS